MCASHKEPTCSNEMVARGKSSALSVRAMLIALAGGVCLLAGSRCQAQIVRDVQADFGSYCPAPPPGSGITTYNGVCEESFAAAVADAKSNFIMNASLSSYTLTVPAGTFDFSSEPGPASVLYPDLNHNGCQSSLGAPSINLSGVSPTSGMFILQGAGKTRTILITDPGRTTIGGQNISNVNIEDITFSRPQLTTSQGTVVSLNFSTTMLPSVTLEIQSGFPSPAQITSTPNTGSSNKSCYSGTTGRYLQRYDYTVPGSPTPHPGDDRSSSGIDQVPWGYLNGTWNPSKQSTSDPQQWTIFIDPADKTIETNDFTVGSVIAIKSKDTQAGAYNFDNRPLNPNTGDLDDTATSVPGGANVTFNNIIWMREARGTWKGGFTGSQVQNSSTGRETVGGVVEAIGSPAGGPQFNQVERLPSAMWNPINSGTGLPVNNYGTVSYFQTSNNQVHNYQAVGTGDDALAFFNDNGTVGAGRSDVENSSMTDSFARDLLETCAPNLLVRTVTAPYIVATDCSATAATASSYTGSNSMQTNITFTVNVTDINNSSYIPTNPVVITDVYQDPTTGLQTTVFTSPKLFFPSNSNVLTYTVDVADLTDRVISAVRMHTLYFQYQGDGTPSPAIAAAMSEAYVNLNVTN